MKLLKIHIILWLPILLICSICFTTTQDRLDEVSVVLQTDQKVFEAGDAIVLSFKLNRPVKTQIFLHTAIGSTILESNTGRFMFPKFLSNKKGVIIYSLLYKSKVLVQGNIQINANLKTPVLLESYIGPPSITAGGEDFTMQVVIPKDSFDNPLPDSTAVSLKHQFLDIKKEETVYSANMIAWKNLFSYPESGRLLISSNVRETASKEFSIEVFPSLPQDFEIYSERKHSFADGNQITSFTTSILKDKHGNIISDGTQVVFLIKNMEGSVLQTQGSTINGWAVAKILHPDFKDTWKIKAYVQGMAESNVLTLNYKSVLDDFDVKFIQGNREVIVGPLLSFMKQLIPDGAIVTLKIFKNYKLLETKIKTSSNGIVKFNINEEMYSSGKYDVKIKALGVQKEYKNIQLQ